MKIRFIAVILLTGFMASAAAQTMSFNQVLQQVIDHYPSVKTAIYQLERAQQENRKIESQLGWQLKSQAGFSRDVSAFGTATDYMNVAAGFSRKLTSGATLGVEAAINKSDASTIFPGLPNPVTSTNINLNYRQPLEKGMDNPEYHQGLEAAAASEQLAMANQKATYDQLASRVIEIYLAAAITQARIKSIAQAIVRSQRLKKYINSRLDLGVSEEKDSLQVEAQLRNQQAEYQGLLMIWEKQKISLNKLMGKAWDTDVSPLVDINVDLPELSDTVLFEQVKQNSSSLLNIKSQLQLADTTIQTRRDAKKNNLDLVMFVGNKSNDGDSATGTISESELVGGVRIEFNRGMDKSGYDAELYQAQIDRGIVLQNQQLIMEDLQYNLSSLLAEIKAGKSAFDAYKKSADSEEKKRQEAERRYKEGRADTDQLIQFESQLSLARLSVDLQKIELLRRFYALSLLRGKLWESIHLPDVEIELN